MAVVEEHKLILTDVGLNSNKFWEGRLDDNNSVTTRWGRVGEPGQSQTKSFGSVDSARRYLNSKRSEKERKGYSAQRTVGAAPVKVVAHQLIQSNSDTKDLIDYLMKVNIHQITAHTNISFDVASGSFQTPLGIVTADGIDDAERLLGKISPFIQKGKFEGLELISHVNNYMRIIPTDIGRKKLVPELVFPDIAAIQSQQQIIDALRASLLTLDTKVDNAPISHRAKVTMITDDGGDGTKTFQRILKKYLGSMNDKHVSSKMWLRRVYEIEINAMSEAFAADGAKMSNIWELWHGTRAANLLSILNSGYVVPRSGGSISVTGRMYGDGVYFSDQSTKSLNYSAGYWGGGKTERTFMLLNDVAMGKQFIPTGSFSGGCKPGYDSTHAKAGQSGVINSEMIVYRTSQICPRYLCEFS